ncbi:class I SAM-dependent methyltransferase [Rhodobacteraceae bacterium N5(2021)]|uniref:Class I SAM-dependent methyltransferase n=1 Tax=Gymnodinialimonas phycosphaerae TaxID=2841589 RepID=A0A975TVR1_9RHOB|nr:class I SAM-dependent methyltransferase [Gymnodinialimonas phycosphaerae]MBY4891832.1 class I SAM-dependent methyltransferase [Gymnodinialimonas phycosphaerae]
MSNELDGYFSETAYPSLFHERLTPANLSAMARRHGWAAPDLCRAFRMLDIGCGDGLGLALTAASHPEARFEGLDGMAEHIARGRAFGAGLDNLDLTHALFDEALAQQGPPCDFVTMHGVIAWVPPLVRGQAMDLAAQRTAPGGICAISYNALPGWTDDLIYQHTVYNLARSKDGSGFERFRAAHDQVRAMAELNLPGLGADVADRVEETFAQMPPDYFPHEYLNDAWQPLWSADVKAQMAARGLTYLGQAIMDRTRPDLTLRSGQRAALEEVEDDIYRDSLVDVIRNTRFRIDLYGKDPQHEAPEAFDTTWLVAHCDADVELMVRGPAGTIRFDNPAARGVVTALQSGPARLDRLAEDLGLGLPDIRNAVDCLLIARLVRPAAPPAATEVAEALNTRLANSALTPQGPDILALAGAHGPMDARAIEVALHATSPADILSAAASEPVIRARYLASDADLDDPETAISAAEISQEVRRRMIRLGVAVRNSSLPEPRAAR